MLPQGMLSTVDQMLVQIRMLLLLLQALQRLRMNTIELYQKANATTATPPPPSPTVETVPEVVQARARVVAVLVAGNVTGRTRFTTLQTIGRSQQQRAQ